MTDDRRHEDEVTPQSGWVGVAVILIVLVAAGITGNFDYTEALESERDQLRERVTQLEAMSPRHEACMLAQGADQ